MHILFVGDLLRKEGVVEVARRQKYHIDVVASATEALQVIDKKDVDVVVSDVLLPRTDGYTLCRMIRNRRNAGHIPVILCSSFLTRKQCNTFAKENGAFAFYNISDPERLFQGIKQAASQNATNAMQKRPEQAEKAYNEDVIRHISSCIQDNAESKEAKKLLQYTHWVYQKTIENALGVPYRLFYADNKYDFMGHQVKTLLGVTAEELTHNMFLDMVQGYQIIDPHVDITDPDEYDKAFRAGELERYQMDIHIKTMSGEEKWLSDCALPIREEKTGTVVGSMGILQDITVRKQNEEQLEFRIAMEQIVSTISKKFLHLEGDEIDDAINETLKMLGEFSGVDRTFIFLIHDDRKTISNTHEWVKPGVSSRKDQMQNIPVNKTLWIMKGLHQGKAVVINNLEDKGEKPYDGLYFFDIKSMLSVPLMADNKLDGFLGLDFIETSTSWEKEDVLLMHTIADIIVGSIKRKKAEKEKKEIYSQLLQAQKMEAVGSLAGGVAHDFNNLLTIITGHSQLLMKKDKDGNFSKPLENILDAADRAKRLTRQLLLFSRKHSSDFKSTSLNTIIAKMDDMLTRAAGENIELRTTLTKDLWSVTADQTNIEQILLNLIVNARDAMPDGGEIEISTTNISKNRLPEKIVAPQKSDHVCMTVRDNGTGIPEHIRDKVFDPFFTTKHTDKGTGLGLSVVYGIVKEHNGWIFVNSGEQQGTTFDIYLPRSDQESESEDLSSIDQYPPGYDRCVLLIEDDSNVLDLTVNILESNGYRVLQASDKATAENIFKKHKEDIDCVLCDVVLKKTSGVAVVKSFLPMKPELPVVFMSGYVKDRFNFDKFEKEFLFLQKPFTIQGLLQKVSAAIPE